MARTKAEKETYNKISMAESIKYWLDNMGYRLVRVGVYRIQPEEIPQKTAQQIANHILTDMQNALVSENKSLYFPEIGAIDIRVEKAGRNRHNVVTKELYLTDKDYKRLKIKPSQEIISRLNPESNDNK